MRKLFLFLLIGMFLFSFASAVDVTTDLQAYYKFQETTGVVVDETHVFNGTVTDADRGVTGIVNNAFDYERGDSSNFVDLPDMTDFTNDFSISFWTNIESFNDDQRIISFKDDYNIHIKTDGTNKIVGTLGGAPEEFDIKSGLSTGTWYHVVLTRSGTTTKAYVNGVEEYSATPTATVDTRSNVIGKEPAGTFYFDGKVDELGVWSKALSATEVEFLYNNGGANSHPFNTAIILNSPTDTSIRPTALTTFNATAITNGTATNVALVNMSLWTNNSGWGIEETITGSAYENAVPNPPTSTYAGTGKTGWKVNFTENTLLTVVTLQTGGTATKAYICSDYACTTTYATASISSLNATFNYAVTAGTDYFILVDAEGASYTINYLNGITSPSYPKLSDIVWYQLAYNKDGNPSVEYSRALAKIHTSSLDGGNSLFSYTIPAGTTTWNVEACDSNGDCGFATSNYTVTLDSTAPTITNNYPTSLIDYGADGEDLQFNWTVTDTNLDTCWYDYNGTNETVSCSTGVPTLKNISLETGNKNITYYANDTAGNLNSTFTSWDYKIFENSRTHNTSSYETEYETYTINVTANSSLTGVTLDYNGTGYSMTNQGSGIWSYSRDLPSSVVGNNSVSFNFTYAGGTIEADTTYQNVEAIVLAICNATYTVPYLNITFADESTLAAIDGTMPLGNFNYYLGNGNEYKTLQHINTSENANYTLCFSTSNETLNIDPYVQYASSGYPQRIWNPAVGVYNNTTTTQVLYLLGSSDGIYVTFQVLNSVQQAISGVDTTAVREISGSDVTVATGTTGADGSVTFWLNPDFSHDFTFTKTGYTTYETSFAPTQTSYTIQMTSTSTSNLNESYFKGVSYSLSPNLKELVNDTEYTFGINLTSSSTDIDEYGFSLRLSNGTIITGGSTTSLGTLVSINYSTTNQSVIYLDYYWLSGGDYTNRTQRYLVFNSQNTGWSIANFFNRFNSYIDVGFFGIDAFAKKLLIFLVLFISIGVLSYKFGLTSPSAISFAIFAVVFFFDVAVDFIPAITLPNGTPVNNILTFITFMIFLVFLIREAYRS